jgi:Concanavalin A-like lectin/glucanases superfamily/Bacterial TSP3 repeat
MRLEKPLSALAFALAFSISQGADLGASTTSFTPLGQNSYRLDWIGEDGVTYFPQFSIDLVDWSFLPAVDQGFVHDPIDVTPLDGEMQPHPKFFMRLAKSHHPSLDPKGADFDDDGISNWQELTVFGTDPLKFSTAGNGLPDGYEDTDNDGISDQWERILIDQAADPESLALIDIDPNDDFDGDGITNLQEFLFGLNGYQMDTDGDGYTDRLSVDQSSYFKLDESSGLFAGDSSGNANHGALVNSVVWQPLSGITGGSLLFDGGTGAIELPEATLNQLGDFTVSLWFKTTAVSNQTFLSAVSSSQAPALTIGIEGGNAIRVATPGGSTATWNYPRSLADGLWHHLAVVRNATTGQAVLHLDGATFGVSQAVSTASLAVEVVALGQQHLTGTSYISTEAFSGSMDEVRIWSALLDSSHFSELFRPNDLDQDGLPDDYEIANANSLTILAGAGNDADGDSISDRHEFETGSHPTDYYNGQLPVITLISGSGQSIYNGSRTAAPLVFLVTNGINPLAYAPVNLNHPGFLGALETLNGDQIASALTLRTDANGKVSIHFKAD